MKKLTQKAIALAEMRFLRSAEVLAVRTWEPGSIREIDLHLPDCDMSGWTSAQHIKCKVGTLSYRDYTPLGWDPETSTCTLLIQTGHEGVGSQWARQLRSGDTGAYSGIGSSRQRPVTGGEMVFLGDESSIGHFLALKQLAGGSSTISGAVLIRESHHQREFHDYFPDWGLEPLKKRAAGDYEELEEWVWNCEPREHPGAVYYLTGYIPAVAGLRKLLRKKGVAGSQIQAQGFWD